MEPATASKDLKSATKVCLSHWLAGSICTRACQNNKISSIEFHWQRHHAQWNHFRKPVSHPARHGDDQIDPGTTKGSARNSGTTRPIWRTTL